MTANAKPILSDEEIVEAAEGYCPSLPDMPFAGARPAVQQSFRAGARFALAAAEKSMQRELECREKLVEALDKAMKHFDCGPTCSVPCDNNCCTANIGRAALAAAKEMNDKHLTLESLSAGIVRKIIALRKELGE